MSKAVKRRVGRPPKDFVTVSEQALSRERVIDAALKLCATQDAPARFTVIALAKMLNVTPMSINYHFGDKSALIRAILAHVNSVHLRARLPSQDLPWRQYLIAFYERMYEAISPYPGLAREVLTELQLIRPDASTGVFEIMDAVIGRLLRAGFDEAKSAEIWHLLTLFCLSISERSLYHQEPEQQRLPKTALNELPALKRAYPAFLKVRTENIYELGLRAFIDGLPEPRGR
jgi:AcrR family transcriptional regulator